MTPCAIVPAAGKSERFGAPKLLALLRGEPLIAHTVRALLDAGLPRVVVVSAPIGGLKSVAILGDSRVEVVVNPNPSRGMFTSIQTGVAVAADADSDPMLVLPGDMPFVSASTIRAVLAEAERTRAIVVPVHHGKRGHPIAVPGSAAHAIQHAPEHATLKDVLGGLTLPRVELSIDDPGIVRDVDVRADLVTDEQ